ncbi:baseplate assembly protein [Rummeliibacillus stabekisii]|uniref:Uncharacterized protein n=1 Tax=Rummeliibacillus stabekisii TaxID=241244 RepID=A0A143HC25_9BACL|nr:baseplate J/gp47 family protein [Rummeliibacillus stabekisii]AMW99303.1 hypothetical protein ATY39_07390 [Rummeliibacillus stabekisii]
MTRFNLPDNDFVDDTVEDLETYAVNLFESEMGGTVRLEDGDPRRNVLKTVAMVGYMILNNINYVGKQNRLSDAEDIYLDFYGNSKNTPRKEGKPAVTILQFECDGEPFIIPKGTEVYINEHFFAADVETVVEQYTEFVEVPFTATEIGSGANGFLPGQITELVSPDEFEHVLSVQNIMKTTGGTDIESDDDYAARIQLSGNQFATAGPEEAWIFHAKSADGGIFDVYPDVPEANIVNLYLLATGGEFTTEAQKKAVLDVCNDKTIRPMGDLVSVLDPITVSYNIDISYYCEVTQDVDLVQKAIENAVTEYVLWQKSKIGRGIDPTQLLSLLQIAGAQRLTVSPNVYQAIGKNELAVAKDININFKGVIND